MSTNFVYIDCRRPAPRIMYFAFITGLIWYGWVYDPLRRGALIWPLTRRGEGVGIPLDEDFENITSNKISLSIYICMLKIQRHVNKCPMADNELSFIHFFLLILVVHFFCRPATVRRLFFFGAQNMFST